MKASQTLFSTFTDIIIGGGTAGCLLANRLSQDKHRRVVVIEMGTVKPSWRQLWMKVPVGYLRSIGNPQCDYMFRTQEIKGLGGRRLQYPRGRILGGCTAINGMIYMRGQRKDYDGWAAATQDASWRWESVLPLFMRHEDYTIATEDHKAKAHGVGGEWTVSQQRLQWPILDAVQDAAVAIGIPQRFDFNDSSGNNLGVGYFDVSQRGGMRLTAADAFLPKALRHARRDNLTFIGEELVRSIGFDKGGRATHVVLTDMSTGEASGRVCLDTDVKDAVIILAAGAVSSPCILERSGIGSREVLSAAQMDVMHHLPGVGANLQDHLQIRTHAEVRRGTKTLNTMSRSLLSKMGMGLEYGLMRSGPLSMAPSQLGIFASTKGFDARCARQAAPDGSKTQESGSETFADAQFHVQPLSLDAFGQPLHPYPAITLSVCNLNPSSRGSVHVSSGDPRDHPLIDPNYLDTADDRAHALRAVRLARVLTAASPLSEHIVKEVAPGAAIHSDDALLQRVAEIATTIFHPVGTCKMGAADDPLAVVDSGLRVHGTRNVFVADASIMPSITSGNTAAPVLMIAEKLAQTLLTARSSA